MDAATAQPAWLSEDLGSLSPDRALNLFGEVSGHGVDALAAHVRAHPGLTRLIFRAEGLVDAAIATLADVGVDVEVEYLDARRLGVLLPFADRVVGLRLNVPEEIALEAAEMVARYSRLRRLDTHLAGWNDEHLAVAVAPLTELAAIDLRAARLFGTGLAALPHPERLRSLDLTELGPTHITGDAVAVTDQWAVLARFTGLQRFHAPLNRLEGDALGGLRHATDLRELNLIGVKWAKPKLDFLGALASLERLSWNVAGTAKALDGFLARMGRLRELSLYDKVTDATFAAVAAGCPALTSLQLHAAGATDAGVARLGGLTSLTSLLVPGDGITDACVEALAGLRGLVELGVAKSAVTDAFVTAAGRAHPALRRLDLAKTAVTDACVDAISTMPALQSVGLGKTKVSKKGLARLRAARPELHVSTYA